jgi:hypothetical protein
MSHHPGPEVLVLPDRLNNHSLFPVVVPSSVTPERGSTAAEQRILTKDHAKCTA